MKRVLDAIWFFAISVLMAAPAFAVSTPKGKPFVYLNNQTAELRNSVSSIQEQIDSLVQNVSSLEERVGALDTVVGNLQTQNLNLASEMASYGMSIDSMRAQISGLESENDWLRSQIEAASHNRTDQLQAQLDQNASKIASLQAAVNNIGVLQSQIDDNTTLIQSLKDEIVKINGYLALKQDIVNGFCPSGSAISQILEDGSVVCTAEGAGATGVSYSRSYNMVDIPALQYRSLSVSCPAGTVATGGGYNGYEVTVKNSIPSESGSSWDLYFQNTSRYVSTIGYGYAVCIGKGQ